MSKNLHCVSKTGRFYTRPTHAHRRALPFLRSNSSLLLPQNMVQLVRAINHPMADCPPPLLPWPLQLSGRLTARDSRRTVTVCAHPTAGKAVVNRIVGQLIRSSQIRANRLANTGAGADEQVDLSRRLRPPTLSVWQNRAARPSEY